jgi:hypothetical protein
MKIELKEISIRSLVAGYKSHPVDGVVGYGGLLDIRPAYQREFVYKDKQRDAVIDTVRKGFPLNTMYWVKNSDTAFEVLDGQQRTISICQYVSGDYSINHQFFHNLTDEERDQILDYKLMIYICEGEEREKLTWFTIVNIGGVKLTNQELRNAVYTGSWLSEAKAWFSKPGCPAYNIGKDYLTGSIDRQDYLETALDWISEGNIEDYMSRHQLDQNANELWLYFQSVINWVSATFTKKRVSIMKGVNWGELYNLYKDVNYDTSSIETKISKLILDDDVTKKSGIYPYILTGDEKWLSIRAFSFAMKQKTYEKQNGLCIECDEHFELEEMEADHIDPWSEGGKTNEANCQLLCKAHNRRKSNK